MKVVDKINLYLTEAEVLNEATNANVMDMFINQEFPKNKEEAKEMGFKKFINPWPSAGNLKIKVYSDKKTALINYFTPILIKDNSKWYFNTQKYSVTTSKIQSQIKGKLEQKKINYKEVDDEKAMELVR